jgi:hypothetical protein
VSLIVVHDLWERAKHDHPRDQIMLFDVVTALAVVFGIPYGYRERE